MYTKEYVIRHVWSRAPGQTCLSLSLFGGLCSQTTSPLLLCIWLARLVHNGGAIFYIYDNMYRRAGAHRTYAHARKLRETPTRHLYPSLFIYKHIILYRKSCQSLPLANKQKNRASRTTSSRSPIINYRYHM